MTALNRRRALRLISSSALLASAGGLAMPSISRAASGHVVVIGGGFGGATAARYIKRADANIRVTLVEPAQRQASRAAGTAHPQILPEATSRADLPGPDRYDR